MPKVRTLQRQVSPTATPTGAQGNINPHLGDSAKLAQDILGAVDTYRQAHEKAVDSSEKTLLAQRENALIEKGRKISIEGRNRRGLAASGFGGDANNELEESVENQDYLAALEGVSPENRRRGLVAYQRTRGRFRTDYGGYEQSEVWAGKRQEYKLKKSNIRDEFAKTPNKHDKADIAQRYLETEIQDLTEQGASPNQAIATALQRVGDFYNDDLKKMIGEEEFEKAQDFLNTIPKDVNNAHKAYKEAIEEGGEKLPYGGDIGGKIRERAARGIDIFELENQAEAQRIFEKINREEISEGEKLKKAHTSTKSNKVRKILTDRFRRQASDFKIADREEVERLREETRVRIIEDAKKGRMKHIMQYLPSEELAKMSSNEIMGLSRFSEDLQKYNPNRRAYTARMKELYFNDREGLREYFKNSKNVMKALMNGGQTGFDELWRLSNARDPSAAKKQKTAGARFPFKEGERRAYVRDAIGRHYPEWATLSEKQQKEMEHEFQARVKNFELDYSWRHGELPSRRQTIKYLYSDIMDKGVEKAGIPTRIWNWLTGQETPEAVPPGTERPDPLLQDIGVEEISNQPAAPARRAKTNWRKAKGASRTITKTLKGAGLPTTTFMRMSDADRNKLLDAINSGDQTRINEALREIRQRYGR